MVFACLLVCFSDYPQGVCSSDNYRASLRRGLCRADSTEEEGLVREGGAVPSAPTYLLRQVPMGSKRSCSVMCDSLRSHGLYRLAGSSVRGIFQARGLEWVAIAFSRGSSGPRGLTQVSHVAGRRFTLCATKEAQPANKNTKKGLLWWSRG